VWVTVVALQILLCDKYKLDHCKEMGAEPGRRFLIQPAAKLEPELLYPLKSVRRKALGWISYFTLSSSSVPPNVFSFIDFL